MILTSLVLCKVWHVSHKLLFFSKNSFSICTKQVNHQLLQKWGSLIKESNSCFNSPVQHKCSLARFEDKRKVSLKQIWLSFLVRSSNKNTTMSKVRLKQLMHLQIWFWDEQKFGNIAFHWLTQNHFAQLIYIVLRISILKNPAKHY